ncbi:hypothetical protein JYU34_016206 [Plutella xylostella]|uniref:Uncharacterized protein n=1 Tax=Plutella xylostella TaxID=51655 RepID=A0ABQ7Q236_PLUXY|nr:hypothetical protein JYU34_016206 [Plutella xylostella]
MQIKVKILKYQKLNQHQAEDSTCAVSRASAPAWCERLAPRARPYASNKILTQSRARPDQRRYCRLRKKNVSSDSTYSAPLYSSMTRVLRRTARSPPPPRRPPSSARPEPLLSVATLVLRRFFSRVLSRGGALAARLAALMRAAGFSSAL